MNVQATKRRMFMVMEVEEGVNSELYYTITQGFRAMNISVAIGAASGALAAFVPEVITGNIARFAVTAAGDAAITAVDNISTQLKEMTANENQKFDGWDLVGSVSASVLTSGLSKMAADKIFSSEGAKRASGLLDKAKTKISNAIEKGSKGAVKKWKPIQAMAEASVKHYNNLSDLAGYGISVFAGISYSTARNINKVKTTITNAFEKEPCKSYYSHSL